MVDILDIFYNSVVKEAENGKVNCYVYYNMAFSTKIDDKDFCECNIDNDDVLVPTLMIRDKEKFDALLIEYVKLAKDFYVDRDFPIELRESNFYDANNKICREKVILAMLFANATVEDFNNPCDFLRKRIDFIKNDITCINEFGYSEVLKGNVSLEIKNDIINNETPYQMVIKVTSENGDEYVFPRIKLGISDDIVYIYAIQNHGKDNPDIKNPFYKKINRVLYKIGEGFSLNEEDSDEKLKDVTSSFLVSLNMCISYLYSNGYSKIVVPSFLVERWNAKSIANLSRAKYRKFTEEETNELRSKQEDIQQNLTNKLVRTFLRLGCHYNNIDIVSFPYEVDSCLNININDNEIMCNNSLLYETYYLVSNHNRSCRKK